MQDTPGPAELLSAVSKFLRDELLPTLSAHHSFQLRVSCNALDLVQRQLALEPAQDAAEIERLTKLLGHDGELAALNADFAQKIADGALTLEATGVKDHLWATTLAKLAVDQPQYGSYKRESTRETK